MCKLGASLIVQSERLIVSKINKKKKKKKNFGLFTDSICFFRLSFLWTTYGKRSISTRSFCKNLLPFNKWAAFQVRALLITKKTKTKQNKQTNNYWFVEKAKLQQTKNKYLLSLYFVKLYDEVSFLSIKKKKELIANIWQDWIICLSLILSFRCRLIRKKSKINCIFLSIRTGSKDTIIGARLA